MPLHTVHAQLSLITTSKLQISKTKKHKIPTYSFLGTLRFNPSDFFSVMGVMCNGLGPTWYVLRTVH